MTRTILTVPLVVFLMLAGVLILISWAYPDGLIKLRLNRTGDILGIIGFAFGAVSEYLGGNTFWIVWNIFFGVMFAVDLKLTQKRIAEINRKLKEPTPQSSSVEELFRRRP